MPKVQRTPEEIEQAKGEILNAAAGLIADIGYDNFTMRKLAAKLGVTATTIYNYYKNKDDLFINLLILGFTDLLDQLVAVCRQEADPEQRLSRMVETYTDFGLNNSNFYNLMYAWHVPKYNHYTGTSMEAVAERQLEIALQIPKLFSDAINAYAQKLNQNLSNEKTRFLVIHFWSQIHGFIAGCNNTILSYLHPDPASLKADHLAGIAEKLKQDISQVTSKGEKP